VNPTLQPAAYQIAEREMELTHPPSGMDEAPVRYRNTRLIDHDGVVHHGDVLLLPDGSWTRSIGDEDVIHDMNGENRLITRSLQNWHTHLAMILNRSMGEGLPLMRWLEESVFPTEKRLTAEFVEVGTRAAAAELLATGTTFACDMYYHPDVVADTLATTGLRAVVCGPITDFPTASYPEGSSQALQKMDTLLRGESPAPGRIEFGIGTHAIYTCQTETLLKASEMAEQHACRLHIHASETRQEVAECHAKHGMYPIEYLHSIGYFQTGTVCAHCGWVTKREMRLLAEHEVCAVHCPVSNMKLATGGTMSYPAMKQAGVDIRLGTDGAGSNNSLDMRAEAKFASLIQRHDHWDPTILDPIETWQLATKGSRDWVTWDIDSIRMRPHGKDGRRLLSNLIYSSADCLDSWVDGNALRIDGLSIAIDEKSAQIDLENAITEYYQGI